eukprot:CAMPEP_0119320812 /NCGR_PEP_ID=MMETSP1333-20130426/53521_1 /TAXON_ID=418940 /ORGANISM="Scyphosphaera apsteinii, Strain RCC1455" /LENGTH=237 /DNA_ID=CAMNT_0007327613 /DNA_START=215 /DNA_END=928 /DNA_ORIENTATION=-
MATRMGLRSLQVMGVNPRDCINHVHPHLPQEQHPSWRDHDVFSDVPFMSPVIIAYAGRAAASLFQTRDRDVSWVATNRSRSAWVASMSGYPIKGGACLRLAFGINRERFKNASYISWLANTKEVWKHEQLEWHNYVNNICHENSSNRPVASVSPDQWRMVYDAHQALLIRHQVPTISLEASDADKLAILCAILRPFGTTTNGRCAELQRNGARWPIVNRKKTDTRRVCPAGHMPNAI